MPKGVEHTASLQSMQATVRSVKESVMPKGVEHLQYDVMSIDDSL